LVYRFKLVVHFLTLAVQIRYQFSWKEGLNF